MPFADLQARKRDLKQQLKQYDMNFARKHGRMPVKAEKEPIRHLYESYNTLKSQITQMEQEGRHLPSATASLAPSTLHRTVSPSSGSDGSDESGTPKISPSPAARATRKLPKPLTTPPIIAGAGDLAALKVEKGNLHTMLRSFEKEFFRENRRQVSSFADIKPVASQYRRYKEIKKAIAALQQGEK
jgi:DNA replication and checkpoint protein